ncbi:MAG: DUF58 domain-containing protein [Gammaproteobacteria bacterium]|nr:DUF58 domain-containing protein [Gammaproteobacteria bacterium]
MPDGAPQRWAPGASTSGFALTQRRIFILPTARGLAYFAALAVMLTGAINYNNSLAYMLVFLLGSLALVSMLHAYRNLAGLHVRPGRATPAFAGEPCRLALCLDNPGPLPRRALTLRHRHPGPRRLGRRRPWAAVALFTPARQLSCADFMVATERRGLMRLVRPRLETRFPLGLFRAWAPLGVSLECLVYPAPGGHLPLPDAATGGLHEGRSREEGQEDFSGHRAFHPGDSPRRVNWKAAARDPRLQVKVFQGGGAGDRVLRWTEAGAGDTEARLSQLCRWVLEAEQSGGHYGLELPGASVPPGRGEHHMEQCLARLARFGLEQDATS